MHCPKVECLSDKIRTTKTLTYGNEQFPRRYTGKNITYRRRQCLACNFTWYTIELEEYIFQTQFLK
jgi:hypothetical protein